MMSGQYLYVVHAEANAIMNKNSADLDGCTLYVTLFPCNECAKLIIQSGVREVVYLSDSKSEKPEFVAARRMFGLAGVECRRHTPERERIVLEMSNSTV